MSTLMTDKRYYEEKIKRNELTVAVFGLGNVGLPMAMAFALKGCRVIGYDIDENKIRVLKSGRHYLPHEPHMEKISEFVGKSLFIPTTDYKFAVKESDVILILVPLLADEKNGIDFSALIDVFKKIGTNLEKGKLIVLSTTVPPGTTEALAKYILEKESGLKAGDDFALAFVPERTKSGTIIDDFLKNYPIIVGGVDPNSTNAVAAFYEAIVENKVIKVSNARTAELVKLFKGFYRYLNIVLADEYAKISEILGVDVLEVIDAANTEPYSHIHKPGPGIGGHCIPVYPYFLQFVYSLFDRDFVLFRVAREIDKGMADHVVFLLFEALNEAGKTVKGSKIAVLGATFRGGVKVTYNTPAKPIVEKIKSLGGYVIIHDPLLAPDEIEKEFGVKGTNMLEEALGSADATILVTDHKEYRDLTVDDFIKKMASPPVIIDSRGLLPYKSLFDNKLRVIYRGIGRPKTLFEEPEEFYTRYINYIKRKYPDL